MDGKAEAAPAASEQTVVRRQLFDDVHAELEPVGLFGIDSQVDIGGGRHPHQILEGRHDHGLGSVGMAPLIARMERGKLDRDAWCGANALPLGGLGDGGERVGVGLRIPLGVGHRLGRLAEHVEAVTPTLGLLRFRPLQRLVDRPPEYKLATENLHRLADRGADHRLAQPPDRPTKRRAPALGRVVGFLENLAGQQQREGSGIDKGRARIAQLFRPVRTGQFVGDEVVCCLRVRDSKQRLREAHKRNAFVAAEVVGGHEGVEPGGLMPAHGLGERFRDSLGLARRLGIEARLIDALLG